MSHSLSNVNIIFEEYTVDPTPLFPTRIWVLRTIGGGMGGSDLYQLSYRTLEGTTVRLTIS